MIAKRIFPELNDYTATVTIAPRSTANAYFPAYPDRQPLFAAMIGERIFPALNDYTATVTIAPRSSANAYFPCISRSSAAFRSYDCERIFFERGNFPLAVKTNRKFGSVSISSSRSAEHRCDTTFAPRHPLCTATSALFADAFAPLSSTMVRAMPLQNISFPYCRAKAFSRRPAMLHCNNSAVLLATALLYRLCQTAPIEPRDRLCPKDLSKEVILLAVRAIFSLFGFDSAAAAAQSNRASPAQLPSFPLRCPLFVPIRK